MSHVTIVSPDYCDASDINLVQSGTVSADVSGSLDAMTAVDRVALRDDIVRTVEGLNAALRLQGDTREALLLSLQSAFAGMVSQTVQNSQTITQIHADQCGGTLSNESVVVLTSSAVGRAAARVITSSNEFRSLAPRVAPPAPPAGLGSSVSWWWIAAVVGVFIIVVLLIVMLVRR